MTLTAEQRRVLTSIATEGCTPLGASERTYMSLARRLLVGTVDGVGAVTARGCEALGLSPSEAVRVGEPYPHWLNQ